jgi:hypothetical protein
MRMTLARLSQRLKKFALPRAIRLSVARVMAIERSDVSNL